MLCCLMYLLKMLTAERGRNWDSLLKDADINPSFVLSAENLRMLIKAGSRISVLTFLQIIQTSLQLSGIVCLIIWA